MSISEESRNMEKEVSTEELFQKSIYSSPSEEYPSEETSNSYQNEEGVKSKLYRAGLYDPGSGEICAAYIEMSRSSVLQHQYYAYPSVKDPGIMKALLFPEPHKVYEIDGQDLYMDLCKEMNVMPVRSFHRELKTEYINLRFYGVNPVGIRAMTLALAYNQTVKRLDLTSNFLNYPDASYHLGQMLGDRNSLTELILDRCNLGHKGVRNLVFYLHTRPMKLLDLSMNDMTDVGLGYLAFKILKGAVIDKLILKSNNLTCDGLLLLIDAIESNNTIKYLNLSWNKFVQPKVIGAFCRELGHSQTLVELDLSWTSLDIVSELWDLFCIKTLKELKLNNNRLGTFAASVIGRGLFKARSLVKLDLTANPFSPADAYYILIRMQKKRVKLIKLVMDFIAVSKEFVEQKAEILKLPYRKTATITHGDVLRNYSIQDQDLKLLTMRRLVGNMQKKHNNKLDILLYLMQENKTSKYLEPAQLIQVLKQYDCPVDETYIQQLVQLFPGPKNKNGKRPLNLDGVVDYIHRLWPDKTLPPTPPPTSSLPKKRKAKKGKK